jgi:hypothetical protein
MHNIASAVARDSSGKLRAAAAPARNEVFKAELLGGRAWVYQEVWNFRYWDYASRKKRNFGLNGSKVTGTLFCKDTWKNLH